ncbi:hypothetical protein ZIOFF_070242 [Zingiber officinale]|uniref:Rab3 GTPase-activating protein catalytic subunit n=1 Tax=Zingiber officinale TaxID=94328 RepID=A0A8J5CER8_ZINOF|nr:hypothetical protein ZIOFF_070242 [Zingiber officinale]
MPSIPFLTKSAQHPLPHEICPAQPSESAQHSSLPHEICPAQPPKSAKHSHLPSLTKSAQYLQPLTKSAQHPNPLLHSRNLSSIFSPSRNLPSNPSPPSSLTKSAQHLQPPILLLPALRPAIFHRKFQRPDFLSRTFELVAIWSSRTFETSPEMAELENASSFDAEKWLLYPVISPNMIHDSPGKFVGFASQLHLLVSALEKSYEAQFLEDFVSVENPASGSSKSSTIPPPTVVDRVLKEIFHDAVASLWIEFVREVCWCWDEAQPLPNMPKGSTIDLSTCLIHQKLQMLAICIEKKNPSHDFESTENVNHTNDEKVNVPSYPSESVKEENDSNLRIFLHQDSEVSSSSSSEKLTSTEEYPNKQTTNQLHKGSAGIVGSMMLLRSCQKMHAPYTQDAPIMTEDMHEERLHAVEALGDAFRFSAQLERDILSSVPLYVYSFQFGMKLFFGTVAMKLCILFTLFESKYVKLKSVKPSGVPFVPLSLLFLSNSLCLPRETFKAANPDAVFEDFIRWHSPGDWEVNEMEARTGELNHWPPQGKLSQRMAEHGNLWRQIWNTSLPLPVSEQKPLLDPIREGEKILHYLETLRPHQLLEQMVCAAFRASTGILNQTLYGDFKHMKTEVDQIYLTIASILKYFQANHLLEKDELIGNLRQLCLVFEHMEKLLILAASVHRKLLDAPRLSEAVFNDYFAFYQPKMGKSLESICYDQEFKTKQLIMMDERDAVASLFPPATATQSWRKVLSMGNLLNGHEPILREIIFSINDRIQDSQYATGVPTSNMEEIQTHRMPSGLHGPIIARLNEPGASDSSMLASYHNPVNHKLPEEAKHTGYILLALLSVSVW